MRTSVPHSSNLFWQKVAALAALVFAGIFSAVAAENPASQLLQISGSVEVQTAAAPVWSPAQTSALLHAGDRLRTGADSRATLRLSDKSVIRIDQNTVVEITPPLLASAKARFRLRAGSVFFLNREKPADIEFETPLATGAIRGTEFYLAAAEAGGDTTLALYDGAVELKRADETLQLTSGQQAELKPGQRAIVSAVLPAKNLIQWAFYYPGVLNPDELAFTESERSLLAKSLAAYRSGDLLAALAEFPEGFVADSAAGKVYHAALKLAAGRVDAAEALLEPLPADFAPALALREVIAAVRFEEFTTAPATSSGWLAHSYYLQSRSQLPAAFAAARKAVELAPEFGFGWARVAELEFSFEHRRAAREALVRARQLAPRHAQAVALEGFLALDDRQSATALSWFDQAIALDAALGNAWFGRALAHEQLRDFEAGRRDLQVAAALEPQRSLFRSYLAKGFSQTHDDKLAEKDFRLAKQFDPGDPTPWLYSALHHQQLNRINEAVRELETSAALNDNRSVFRSRQLLDRDRAVRSADLAAIYDAAGMSEVSQRAASRAVSEDYANFSGHLFLARSLQSREDPNGFNLRYETPRESELLVANLLAPVGGGNLSQLLSQQDHLQLFESRPFGASSLTEYGSGGDWQQSATAFGTVGGLSYAVDGQYTSRNGQRANNELEEQRLFVTLKQQITPQDSVYLQAGLLDREGGDLAQYTDPANANPVLRVKENQLPTLALGYHHEWSPGVHTLVLLSHMRDDLELRNPAQTAALLHETGSTITSAELRQEFDLSFRSKFALTSVEVQQVVEGEHHGIIAGLRYQTGEIANAATLQTTPLPYYLATDSVQPGLERVSGYAYYQFRPIAALRLTAGASYDYLEFPQNAELPPLTSAETSRSQFSPKVALEYSPWRGGNFRAAYTRSLGGLYFDNSVRLEPAQFAGFTTAFRSLIPESVVGLVPGTEFETWGVGFDQSLPSGTYFGIEGEILESRGDRSVGVLTNSNPFPIDYAGASTRQTLKFRESSLTAYANQLVGQRWAFSASYRLSQAELTGRFPDLSVTPPVAAFLNQDERAVLGHLRLAALFNHECGFFAQWQTEFFHQENFGSTPATGGEAFWQHNIYLGYRFAHRRAELRVGVQNLTDEDYRLNPLNLQAERPRARTFVASLKLNY